MKTVTCGFVIRTERGILACHPTGKKNEGEACYDIPKGRIEENETPFVTAMRELKEETGLDYFDDLKVERVIDTGEMSYTKEKNIHIFVIDVSEFPYDFKLHCDSKFENKEGKMVPEMDGYLFTWNIKDFYRSLQNVFGPINDKWKIFDKDSKFENNEEETDGIGNEEGA